LAVGALVLGVAGGVQQAQAQKAAGQAQEAQAKENAKAANVQAQNAVLTGQIEEDRRRQQTRRMLATQRTAFAANNVDMSSGSAADILGDTAAIGEQDALTIRANAAREAWGYKVDANNSMNQGRMANAAAKNNATGTYLTTAGNAMSQGSQIDWSSFSSKSSAPAYTTTGTGKNYSKKNLPLNS
jgi:glucan-binding YG repeat protein